MYFFVPMMGRFAAHPKTQTKKIGVRSNEIKCTPLISVAISEMTLLPDPGSGGKLDTDVDPKIRTRWFFTYAA